MRSEIDELKETITELKLVAKLEDKVDAVGRSIGTASKRLVVI
jgi:hypothetical protein